MQSTHESWKPIAGWEGFYEVSDHGRVRSVDREVRGADGRTQKWRGRILVHNVMPKGYRAVSFSRPGKRGRDYVHRLVMAAFVGPCPPGMEVCHRNGDPGDNRHSNLRYGTFSSNNMDKVGHGTTTRGERNARARLTVVQVLDARRRADAGEPDRSIAASFDVHPETIGYIRRRKSWAWLD